MNRSKSDDIFICVMRAGPSDGSGMKCPDVGPLAKEMDRDRGLTARNQTGMLPHAAPGHNRHRCAQEAAAQRRVRNVPAKIFRPEECAR